jgi:hypothetical protein
MKKILFSLITIGIVGSFSYFLTQAYFTDKKTSSGNTFAVGTLNLEVGGNSGSNVEPFVISDIGSGVNSGSKTWKIKNTGSLPGQFSASLDKITNYENGCNDPEKEVDTTCENPGPNKGELGKYIKVIYYFNGEKKVESYMTETASIEINNQWNAIDPLIVLNPGEEAELKMDWVADDNYGNEIQSDSLDFDMSFSLKQITK